MIVHESVLAYWFQRDLMITLCGVVKDCKNFKVRINAALALGSPAERSHYGDCRLFAFVWESLVIALETSEDITDFAEFKYRNNLNNQVHNLIDLLSVDYHCKFERVFERVRFFLPLKHWDLELVEICKFMIGPYSLRFLIVYTYLVVSY